MQKIILKQFSTVFLLLLFMVSQNIFAQEIPVINSDAERIIKQYEQGYLTNPTFAEKQIISKYLNSIQKQNNISKERILSPDATIFLDEDFGAPIATLTEDFDYGIVADTLINVTANWTRHSGTIGPLYLASSLSYTGYFPPVGGSVGFTHTSAGNGDVNRIFSSISGDTDVFTSFLVNLDSARTQDYFFHIGADPMGFNYRGRVRARDNGAGWSLGLSKSSSGIVEDTTVLNFGQTYLVVLKYTLSTATTTDDVVTLYVYDSGIPASEPGSPVATIGPIGAGESGDLANVGAIAIRQGTNTPSGTIDGIRVGTSWADIFPAIGLPVGWTNVDNGVSGQIWEFDNPYPRTITGNFDADFAILDSDNYGSGGSQDATMTTGAIDLSAAGSTVTLGYDQSYRHLGSTAVTEVSSDGVTWTTIASLTASTGYPNPAVYSEYDISAYSGQSTVYVRWTYTGSWAYWWAIDNVVVYEPDAFPLPAIVVNPLDAATGVSPATTLDWVAGGGAAPTGYRLYFGTDGGGVSLPTSIANNTDLGLVTQYTPASALTLGTTYYWSLVPYNAGGDATGNPIWSFTVVSPIAQPYSEDFNDTTAAGWLTTGFVLYTNHGTSGSVSAGKNFWSSAPTAWMQAPLVGPLTLSSQLEFSYLITDYSWPGPGTVLDADYFDIQVSTDGGTTFTTVFTIDSSNHVTSASYATIIIPLSSYSAQSVMVRWDGQWAAGDYYFDIDDIKIRETPAGAPNPATVVNPLDAATGVSIATTLDWLSGGGALETGYKINFGTDNPPTNIENNTDLGLVTTYTPGSSLAYNTIYYWEIIPYNGSGDATGTVVWSFTTEADPTISTFPYTENFDGATDAPPAGWTHDPANVEDWEFINNPAYAGQDHTSGTGMVAYVDDSTPYDNPSNFLSPPFNLTSLTAPTLTFYCWVGVGNAGPSYLNLDVFNGTVWVDSVITAIVENNGWATVVVDLTPYASTNTMLRFRGIENLAGFDCDVAIDDVTVEEAPACAGPTNLALSNVTTISADIGWLGATTVEIDYGAAGHTAGTGTIVPGVTANPYTLGSLTANTAYDVFVRQDCGPSGYSSWVGPLSFITAQIAATLPFGEDFETWPNNWTVVNGTQTNQWWIGTAAVPYAGTNSAYVSPDSGLTYGYNGTASSVSHLYRDIAFSGSTGGGYNVKFWWKGDGEPTAWDHLRVFLVDPSVLPTPGVELSTGQVGDANYNGQPTYIEATIILPDSLTGTTARLVFQWFNDASVAGLTSVSVDDISIAVVVPGTLSGTITDCLSTNALDGASVIAGSFSTTTNASGFYEFLTIPPGTYDVTASLVGYASTTTTGVVVSEGLTTTQDMCMDELLLPPTNLQASVTGQDVNVTWESPADAVLQWDDGINFNAIGTNAAAIFDVASRWPVADIAPLDGKYLKKVRFYPNEAAATYTIKVWQGADVSTLVEVYSEVVISPVIGEMNEVTLATAVLIDGTEEFWFGYNVNTTTGFPAGCDVGPPVAGKGNMMYFGGIWQELTDLNATLTYNWNITGSVYNTIDKSESVISLANIDRSSELNNQNNQLDKLYLKNVTFSAKFDEVKPNYEQNNRDNLINSGSGVIDAVLTGYNVYRDDTLVVASNIADLFYNDLSVPYGLHSYSVTAVYVEGESGPAGPVNVDVVNPNLDTIYVYPTSANYWTGTTDGTTKTDTSEVRCMNIEHGWMMFDVSAIDDSATISKIRYYGYANSANWAYWSATPLAGLDPLTATASDLYNAADTNSVSGTAYIFSNEGSGFAPGWHDYLMETWANTDLEAALAQDWFAMGMATRDYSTTYHVNWDGWAEPNVPYLEVVYEVPGGATTFPLAVQVVDGWNMVSVPGLHPVDQNVTTWWSNLTGSVFKFSAGYTPVTTTATGEGYWMKNSGAEIYSYTAIEIVTNDPIPAAAGWNMIGGYENSVLTSGLTTTPSGLISSLVFGYSGGYQVADNLVPGYGYWIKLTGAGVINIPSGPLAKGSSEVVEYIQDDWGKITITDNAGRSYTLYAVKGEVNLENYELPPLPPTGMFDIRYGSGRLAEDISSSIESIEMTGLEYPITVKVEGMDIRVQDETGKNINENIKSGDQITISSSQINKLMVTGELIPDVYALEQNYPNPFNPSTTIEFSLPEDVSNVQLTIYDILGQRVTQLVNTSLKAGKYKYQWNAGNVATGMYIYELRTDKFVSIKKMVLLK